MKMKTTIFLTVAVLLVGGAAAQTQPTQTDRASVSIEASIVNTDPAPLQSGEAGDLTFKIRNTGNTEARNVQVQLVDSFPFELKPGQKRNRSLGDVVPGQEYQISTEVLVGDNAPDGMNDFKLRITQGDFSVIEEVPVRVQSQNIELNLANLKTTPSSLTPDTEDAKMTVEVVNNGDKQAENAVLNIELPEGFEETSSFSTRHSLGNVAPGQTKPAEFMFDILPGAEKGQVEVPAELSYSSDGDSSTSRITENASFSFHLAGKPQFEVVDVESQLKSGSSGELTVEVKNTGSEKSSSTRIRALDSSDQPFDYSSSSKYIGTLEPGQKGTAVFEIDTESGAVAKNYLLDFEVRGVKDTQVYVEDTTVQAEVAEAETDKSSTPILPIAAVVLVLGGLAYFRDRIRELLQ